MATTPRSAAHETEAIKCINYTGLSQIVINFKSIMLATTDTDGDKSDEPEVVPLSQLSLDIVWENTDSITKS